MVILVFLGIISCAMWLGILLHPARSWDFQPVGDDEDFPPALSAWPSVCILVPARNEKESLPHTLPALLTQDYPGEFGVVVIDDRSEDGTAEIARAIARKCQAEQRLNVILGAPLPSGWVGKVWALEQGAAACACRSPSREDLPSDQKPVFSSSPRYFLLTDADIGHAPNSLRRLVAESEQRHLALNSRMARLRCLSHSERLLIPPFVFFFNLLYPMRQVNNPRSPMAGAAGGCVLLRTESLVQAGGFSCIRDRIIDDVSLARCIKRLGAPIQLALSRSEVESLRIYDSIHTIWIMVRRTAFTELRHSWLRLLGTIVGMAMMFVVPPLWTVYGFLFSLLAVVDGRFVGLWQNASILALGVGAWAMMAAVYRPAVRFFLLPKWRCWTLPIAGVLYEGMTLDSALRYVTGRRIGWRDR
ncbi:MAG: glycosyltransferase [Deltaproteobacteria bacterium]|nr:glycosyltransferase [Deltaproteobacteria bacterium]